MTMSITRIEAFLLRAEVKEPVKTSFGSIPRRSVLLLRVEDADGAHGWGKCGATSLRTVPTTKCDCSKPSFVQRRWRGPTLILPTLGTA